MPNGQDSSPDLSIRVHQRGPTVTIRTVGLLQLVFCLEITVVCWFPFALQNADMSIAPMTISSDRQTVLDFTQPYMTFGLAFMMRVQEVNVNYFRFLLPFSGSLWITICVLVMVMGFLVWICSLFSPWGYYGRCLQAKPSKQVNGVRAILHVLGRARVFMLSSRWLRLYINKFMHWMDSNAY